MKKPNDFGFMVTLMTITLIAYIIACVLLCQCRASVNPRDPPFNAAGDGITDDTAALQAAVSYAIGISDEVYLPSGFYLIRSAIQVNGPLTFRGLNEEQSVILLGNPAAGGFNVTTKAPCHLEKLCIAGMAVGSAGAGITVAPSNGSNTESTFYRINIGRANIGFDFESAAYWKVDSCAVFGWTAHGVVIKDTARVDAGDNSITNCLFLKNGPGGAAVYQESSSGLRLVNNKMLGGDYGYFMFLKVGSTTCDLIISNNSIEGQRLSGVFMINAVSGVVYLNAIVAGNEFEGQAEAIWIEDTGSQPWLLGLTLTGNDINIPGVGGVAMDLNGVSGPAISGNYMRSNGGTTYGIVLREQTQNGSTGTNTSVALNYPYTDFGVNNQ